jgi:hypothetical protein
MGHDIKYIGPPCKTVTITEFYNWCKTQFPRLLNEKDGMTHHVSLRAGYRIDAPEHLVKGSLDQDRPDAESKLNGVMDREYWSDAMGLGETDLVVDKIYQPSYYSTPHTPRERISENDLGLKGWR